MRLRRLAFAILHTLGRERKDAVHGSASPPVHGPGRCVTRRIDDTGQRGRDAIGDPERRGPGARRLLAGCRGRAPALPSLTDAQAASAPPAGFRNWFLELHHHALRVALELFHAGLAAGRSRWISTPRTVLRGCKVHRRGRVRSAAAHPSRRPCPALAGAAPWVWTAAAAGGSCFSCLPCSACAAQTDCAPRSTGVDAGVCAAADPVSRCQS